MEWKEPLSDEFIEEILKKFRIKLPNDYISFLKTHRRIDSVRFGEFMIDVEGESILFSFEPTDFNAIEFIQTNTYTQHVPEIKEKDLVVICKCLSGEVLLIGANDKNLGKIFFYANYYNDFYPLANSFTEFKATIVHLID
jgi:hypothetical protein